MMTSNTFLPRLFIFQVIEVAACIWCIATGHYWLAGGCIVTMLMFTLPVDRAYSHEPKMEVNSEILTILSDFDQRLVHAAWKARYTGNFCEHEQVEAELETFKQSIEVDPHDERCIYRWRR